MFINQATLFRGAGISIEVIHFYQYRSAFSRYMCICVFVGVYASVRARARVCACVELCLPSGHFHTTSAVR